VHDAGSVQPPSLTFAFRDLPAPSALRPGQVLPGAIQGTPGSLSVQVAGIKVPIEGAPPFQPGQTVLVEILEGGEGLVLRISPQAAAAGSDAPPGTPPPAASRPPALLTSILDSLSTSLTADTAARLLPANLPENQTALRLILALFATPSAMGQDLQEIAALLSQGAAAGAVPPEMAENFMRLLGRLMPAETAAFQHALESMAAGGSVAMEAQAALALASGNVDELLRRLETDLRTQVAQLRGNKALLTYLRGINQIRAFDRAVNRVLERLDGAQLQNLRTLERPYLFFEMPCDPNGPLRRAQIHFFQEGRGRRRSFDAKNVTVAIDLATAPLGDLWITLNVVRGHCACWFRATSADVVQAIDQGAPELVESLDRIGYPKAHVKAVLWDGNREETLTNLMRHFSGLDVSA